MQHKHSWKTLKNHTHTHTRSKFIQAVRKGQLLSRIRTEHKSKGTLNLNYDRHYKIKKQFYYFLDKMPFSCLFLNYKKKSPILKFPHF